MLVSTRPKGSWILHRFKKLANWYMKDIGIFRNVPGLDTVKPFWVA
jgi:hypothetical protein